MAERLHFATERRIALEAGCPDFPKDRSSVYQDAGLWRGDTFSSALHDASARFGRRTAVMDAQTRLSFVELKEQVAALAGGFRALGLVSGDVAVVQMLNSIRFVETVLALMHIGVVPVLALPAHRKAEIQEFLHFTHARAYIIPEEDSGFDFRNLADALRDSSPCLQHIIVDGTPLDGQIALEATRGEPVEVIQADPGSVALFQISGGTTGIPKLIPRRHQEYLCNIRHAAQASGMDAETVYLCVLPAAHNFPFACPGIFGALLSGGCVVLSDTMDAQHNFDLIERHSVSVTSLVPPVLQAWMAEAEPGQFAGLKQIQVGGARLAEEVARQVRPRLGCLLQQVYGMAEGLVCFTPLDANEDAICAGHMMPMCNLDEVRIVGPSHAPAQPVQTGLLQVRGPYTMNGYFRAPAKNAEAISEDGFYTPGDLVSRQPDGSFCVVGRQKDQINRGGEKLAGEDLENILIAHPSVQDAAVVGMPDPVLGESIHAFIVPSTSGLRPLTLKRFLRDQGIATFKMPDKITFVDRFPMTGVGKISKSELRKSLRDAHGARTHTALEQTQ